jgi:hypothetical protein
MKIKLVGRLNDLELGTVEEGIYRSTGLLADKDHLWKILSWIDQELEDGTTIKVVKGA